jgi:hypothetical protein
MAMGMLLGTAGDGNETDGYYSLMGNTNNTANNLPLSLAAK